MRARSTFCHRGQSGLTRFLNSKILPSVLSSSSAPPPSRLASVTTLGLLQSPLDTPQPGIRRVTPSSAAVPWGLGDMPVVG